MLDSLKDPEEAKLYLQVALDDYQETGDAAALLLALRYIAQARGGLTQLSKTSKIGRQYLYRLLSKEGNPRLNSFGALLKGLGYRLLIEEFRV